MPRKKSGTENELWERMPGESVRHYEYFCAYRDMRYVPAANADDIPKLDLSRERSIRKLAQQLGVAKRTIGDLCSRFNWVARCDAYDLYILRRQRDKNEDRILKMRENHAAVGEQLWKRGLRRAISIPDGEIEAGDMVRMIDVGVKIERLSRGESTEKQEVSGKTSVTHNGSVEVAPKLPDLSALTDEETEAYERILEKLYPKSSD